MKGSKFRIHVFIDKLSRKFWLPFLVIILGVGGLYYQTLFFDYTYSDDDALIKENLHYLNNSSSIINAFTEGIFKHFQGRDDIYYRPMQTVSYILDTWLFAGSLKGYYFTNILIHIFNSCLLFLLLRRINKNVKSIPTLLFTLLFSFHPALSGAVAWIPGRCDLLLTAFTLASFFFFIRYLEKPKIINLLGNIFFFNLALYTKETAIVIPLLYIIYYFICISRKKMGEENALFKTNISTSQFLSVVAPWGVFVVFYVFARNSALPSDGSHSGFWGMALSNLEKNSPALLEYIGKAFFPFRLSTYPTREDHFYGYAFFSILIMILFAVATHRKRLAFFFFGLCWFLIFFLPSLTSKYVFLPESRLYLPLCGLIILLNESSSSVFIKRLTGIFPFSSIRTPARTHDTISTEPVKMANAYMKSFPLMGMIIIILFFFLAFNQSRNYKDGLAYWKDAVKSSPNYPFVHLKLGEAYYWDGFYRNAEKEFNKALELDPSISFFFNISAAEKYIDKKELSAAEEVLEHEFSKQFNYIFLYKIALVYKDAGRADEAMIRLKNSINSNPEFIPAYYSLAAYFKMKKNYDEALWICYKMLKINVGYKETYKMLSDIYRLKKNEEKASFYLSEFNKRTGK